MNNKVFTIVSIVFLLLSNFTYSQEFPTRGEVYDYDIGDVFHIKEEDYYENGGVVELSNIEVIDKTFSINGDAVYYQYFVRRYVSSSESPDPYIEEVIENDFYTALDIEFIGETVFEDPNMYNGRRTVSGSYIIGYEYVEYKFSVGCGKTYFEFDYNDPDEWSEYTIQVLYFKKGDEEWGQEQIIVGLNEIETLNRLLVFPNPVSDNLNIKNANPSSKENKIKIFNSIGKLVIYEEVSSTNMQVNVRGLPNGLYFINQIDESGQVGARSKFVKVN